VTIGLAIWDFLSRWSIWTDRLSCAVFEILTFKGIGVTTLTFRVTWHHRSCDHGFPRCGFLLVVNMNQPCISYCCWDIELQRFWGSRPWSFRVLWRHQSRDHWTPDMQFPIGGPLKPLLYLASLLRYVKHLAKHIPIENALIPIFTPRALRSITQRRGGYENNVSYILRTDRPTDLAFWKISNGHMSATGHPIHFMFGSRLEFSGSADRMSLLPVGPNPRPRPSAVLYNFESPYLWNGSSGPIRIWFYGKSIGHYNARGVIRLVTI